MSDLTGAAQDAGCEVLDQAGPLSAGTMIRNAREASGLHVAALAVAMKIPVKKLEALEADRLDLLHDAVFVRALAASVCRTLKIDPAPVLQKLPSNTVRQLSADERGINAPFQSPGVSVTHSISEVLSRPVVWIFLGLLLGGIGIAFFPDVTETDWFRDFSLKQVEKSSVQSSIGTDTPDAASAPEAAASTISSAPVATAPPILFATTPASSAASTSAMATMPPAVVVQKNLGASAPAADLVGLVVFRAKGPSWIKVVDAKGIVQLSKTLATGDAIGASGSTPLSITIGRADVTVVEVRGKPFDLANVSRENVARFEVK